VRNFRVIGFILSAFLSLLTISGCKSTQPFRNEGFSDTQVRCDAVDGTVPISCEHFMHESNPNFDLLFAEFDDQGWLNTQYDYKKQLPTFDVGKLQNDALDEMKAYLKSLSGQRLRIVVFVHGWKNDAAYDNGNVKFFRRQLNKIADMEKDSGDGRKVVGVYLGWRGTSVHLPDFAETLFTFYDRKDVAHKVAKGAIQSVVSSITAFEARQNGGQWPCKSASPDKAPDCMVNTLFIGHSFGGLILFEAIEPKILTSIINSQADMDAGQVDTVDRTASGDLVVLLNPAIEATRFQPVFRAMSRRKYTHYQSPLMVMVTSSADDATGMAFPLGRFFSTFFEKETTHEEWVANHVTIGHMDDYTTHYLDHYGKDKKVPPCRPEKESPVRCMGVNKGNVLTVATDGDRVMPDYVHFPIWNVRSNDLIMDGHSDLSRDSLADFILSLVQDLQDNPKFKAQ
jgi:hypothetical protein